MNTVTNRTPCESYNTTKCNHRRRTKTFNWSLNSSQGSHTIRKSAKVVTMSLEGGRYPLSLAFGGKRGEGLEDFLSLAFGGKFSHKLDHFWPN